MTAYDEQLDYIDAICADPADDTVRRAYADWLDQHDQSLRAEFIRLQLARTDRLPCPQRHHPRCQEWEPYVGCARCEWMILHPQAGFDLGREDALKYQHLPTWVGGINSKPECYVDVGGALCFRTGESAVGTDVERGFVSALHLNWRTWRDSTHPVVFGARSPKQARSFHKQPVTDIRLWTLPKLAFGYAEVINDAGQMYRNVVRLADHNILERRAGIPVGPRSGVLTRPKTALELCRLTWPHLTFHDASNLRKGV